MKTPAWEKRLDHIIIKVKDNVYGMLMVAFIIAILTILSYRIW